MISDKIKQYLIEELEEAEEYLNEVFYYLKELEEGNPKDSRLQEEIWNLCEAGELVSRTAVQLDCIEEEPLTESN